jgi:hypothetical protein
MEEIMIISDKSHFWRERRRKGKEDGGGGMGRKR